MLDWPSPSSVLDRLARGEPVADLVQGLHRTAVEQSGATCSLLLNGDPSTGIWRVGSAFGVTPSATDDVDLEDGEADELQDIVRRGEAVAVAALAGRLPCLA